VGIPRAAVTPEAGTRAAAGGVFPAVGWAADLAGSSSEARWAAEVIPEVGIRAAVIQVVVIREVAVATPEAEVVIPVVVHPVA